MRAQAIRQEAQAGAGAVVSTQYSYTIGPDGQRYATSARITTSQRTEGPPDPLALQGAPSSQPLTISQNRKPLSLADYARPNAGLSPSDEAAVFGSQAFLDEIRSSNAGSVRARLQLSDFSVRAQEGQHFRAAAGLGTAPKYEYQVGPDGKLYAVAGEVGLKAGPAATPEDAAQDAATFARAALAATDVSAQDVSVARAAQSRAASFYAASNTRDESETPRFQLAA